MEGLEIKVMQLSPYCSHLFAIRRFHFNLKAVIAQ